MAARAAAKTAKLASQTELARHLDLSDRQVRRLTAGGLLTKLRGRGYDIDACRVAYLRHLREQAAGRRGDGRLDLAQERAALAREQREGVRLRNAVLAGQYVLRKECQRVLSALVILFRQRMLALPEPLAARVFGAPSTPVAAERIREVLHGVLEELSEAEIVYADDLDEGVAPVNDDPSEEE